MLLRNLLSVYQKLMASPTSALEARGCPGTGVVREARGCPANGGVGGCASEVEQWGQRGDFGWSARQDQLLRSNLEPFGQKQIPWKEIEGTLAPQFPGKVLGTIKRRWPTIRKKEP